MRVTKTVHEFQCVFAPKWTSFLIPLFCELFEAPFYKLRDSRNRVQLVYYLPLVRSQHVWHLLSI